MLKKIVTFLDSCEMDAGNWDFAVAMANVMVKVLLGLPASIVFAIAIIVSGDAIAPFSDISVAKLLWTLSPTELSSVLDHCSAAYAWSWRSTIVANISVLAFGLPIGIRIWRATLAGTRRHIFSKEVLIYSIFIFLAAIALLEFSVIHMSSIPVAMHGCVDNKSGASLF